MGVGEVKVLKTVRSGRKVISTTKKKYGTVPFNIQVYIKDKLKRCTTI